MDNMCYLLLLTLIVLMDINMGLSTPINDKDLKIEPYHLKEPNLPWKEFSCNVSQLRSYVLTDLMESGYREREEFINIPLFVVLKRCDVHSGCCGSNVKTCAPKKSEIYYEKVEIEIESIRTNRTRKEWILVEQHGGCYCKKTTTKEWQDLEKQKPIIRKI